MLIECSKCGAPLDVGESQTIAKCIYCGGSNRVARTKTIAMQTPSGWQAPPTWQQPPAARPRNALLFAAIGAGVLGVAGVAALVGSTTSSSSGGTTGAAEEPAATVAEIATLELTVTPAQISQRFPFARVDEDGARIVLRDPRFEAVILEWNPERDHLVEVFFDAVDGIDRAPVLAALRPHLGHRFVDDANGTSASWPASGMVRVDATGNTSWIAGPADDDSTHVDWRLFARAKWTLFRSALLGAQVPIDAPTREVLAGYSLSRVAELDVTVPVDQAERSAAAVLPGSSTYLLNDLAVNIAVDHPWFKSVTLNWENAAAGRLKTVQIWSLGDSLHDLEAIARCLTPLLGAPEIQVTDHLRNERSFRWNHTTGSANWWERGIDLAGNAIWLAMTPGPDLADHYRSILRTLDACGR